MTHVWRRSIAPLHAVRVAACRSEDEILEAEVCRVSPRTGLFKSDGCNGERTIIVLKPLDGNRKRRIGLKGWRGEPQNETN